MPDAFARLLQRLVRDGRAPRSQFSAQSVKRLQSLLDAGTLCQTRSGGGLAIEVRNPDTLAAFYRHCYPSGQAVLSGPPRMQAVATLRNAKRASRTDKQPVLVRALAPLVCERDNIPCDLWAATRQTGVACLLLEEGHTWSLTTEIAVVENLECFLHFETMGIRSGLALYAAGRLSDLVLEWFRSPGLSRCRFVHCGDYDPVGLDEFLRLKAAVGDRARLHLPDNLDTLIATYGRPELLRHSQSVLQRLRASREPQITRVVRMLDETGRGLEQEVLLMTHEEAEGGCNPVGHPFDELLQNIKDRQ